MTNGTNDQSETRKKGLKTSELWVGLAGAGAIIQMGAQDADSTVRAVTMGAVAVISAVYIWSRTKLKGQA